MHRDHTLVIYKRRKVLCKYIHCFTLILFTTGTLLFCPQRTYFVMKIKMPKMFRKKKTTLGRRHTSQPSINTLLDDFSNPSSSSGSSSSDSSGPPRRSKSSCGKNRVNLKHFMAIHGTPVLTLLPVTLPDIDDRCSFTTIRTGFKNTKSFVRKMGHPRLLPSPPRLIPDISLNNGAFRRSLPDLRNNVEVLI